MKRAEGRRVGRDNFGMEISGRKIFICLGKRCFRNISNNGTEAHPEVYLNRNPYNQLLVSVQILEGYYILAATFSLADEIVGFLEV